MTVVIKPGVGHLDKLYSKFVYNTVPFWHALKITPNILTTFGLLSSIACVYFIYKRKAAFAIVFLLLRMYFDIIHDYNSYKYRLYRKTLP